MDLRRVLHPRRPGDAYDQALRDVLGAAAGGPVDTLALLWAHQIAWGAHGGPSDDEVYRLSGAADRYGVPLTDLLAERTRQLAAPPVVPAVRGAKDATRPATVSRLHRPA